MADTMIDISDDLGAPIELALARTAHVHVSRTFRSSPTRSWALLASDAGATAWLGDAPGEWWHDGMGGPDVDDVLETAGGERYEVREIERGTLIRLRTLGPALAGTTIQLRIDGEQGRTVIDLDQDGIADERVAEGMRAHWTRAFDRIATLLDDD